MIISLAPFFVLDFVVFINLEIFKHLDLWHFKFLEYTFQILYTAAQQFVYLSLGFVYLSQVFTLTINSRERVN